MSGQAADSVDLKVNTVFNLGAKPGEGDTQKKKPFEVKSVHLSEHMHLLSRGGQRRGGGGVGGVTARLTCLQKAIKHPYIVPAPLMYVLMG